MTPEEKSKAVETHMAETRLFKIGEYVDYLKRLGFPMSRQRLRSWIETPDHELTTFFERLEARKNDTTARRSK